MFDKTRKEIAIKIDLFGVKKILSSKYAPYIALALIALFAFQIRTAAVSSPFLNGDDPYILYRMSDTILNTGSLPANDTLKHYPIGYNFQKEYVVWYYTGAAFGALAGLFGAADPALAGAHIYPPVMAALMAIIMFFFARDIFGNRKLALLASLFVASLPAIIYRSNAAFTDKEPIGGVFILLGLWLFAKSLKKFDWRLSVGAALSFLALSLTWGGIRPILFTLGLFGLLMIGLNKFSRGFVYTYLTTIPLATGLGIAFASGMAMPFSGFRSDPQILTPLVIAAGLLFVESVRHYKLFSDKTRKHIGTYLVMGGIVAFALVAFVYVPLGSKLAEYAGALRAPLADNPMSSTVAESRPSDLNEILNSQLGNNFVAPQAPQVLQQIAQPLFSAFRFLNPFVLAIFGAIIVAAKLFWRKTVSYEFGLLLIAWFAIVTIAGLGAVRLIFLTAFPIALLAAVGLYYPLRHLWNLKVKTEVLKDAKLVGVLLITGIIVSMQVSTGFAFGPSLQPSMNQEWQDALLWVKNNSAPSDVIISWWDYGYIIQKIAQRPTYVDPQNAYVNRNREVAQLFTSTNETEGCFDFDKNKNVSCVDWLKERNVKYIMHDVAMIGKYSAVSQIGSWGDHVDQLPVYRFTGNVCAERNNATGNCTKNVMMYGPLWFVQTPSSAYVTLLMQTGEVNMSRICTSEGVFLVDPKGLPGCAYLAQDAAALIGVRADKAGAYTVDLSNTNFVRQWFFNAQGMRHFKLAYQNPQVKVFEVLY